MYRLWKRILIAKEYFTKFKAGKYGLGAECNYGVFGQNSILNNKCP